MPAYFDDILTYFREEHESNFTIDEENQIVRASVQGENLLYETAVLWDDATQRISFRVVNIAVVPERLRDHACVLTNLINWQLILGNFEIDMEDGEMAFRISFDVDDGALGQKQINTHFMLMLALVDKYYPAFQRLMWQDYSPMAAFRTIEEE